MMDFAQTFRERAGDVLADRVTLTPYEGEHGSGFCGVITESDIKTACCVRSDWLNTPEGHQSVAEGLVNSLADAFPYGAHRECDPFLTPVSAADPIAARRRTLFDRVIAMDPQQLAAMERCAGMIEGNH